MVGRFAWIHSADTQQLVEERNNTIPEWMRLTDEMLLEANTEKASYVVEALAEKHIDMTSVPAAATPRTSSMSSSAASPQVRSSSAAGSVGKTLVYSLYNSELYIALTQMQRLGGWSDAGSAYWQSFDDLADYMKADALSLGYTAESWPNWPADDVCPDGVPSWEALEGPDTRRPGWQKAATTLGLSANHWPPPTFNRQSWLTHRPKYHIVASGDEVKVGLQMRTVRAQALQEFKNDPTIDVLLMDGVATVGHDLSFVSDIICMESVTHVDSWNQLISRAYELI